VSSGSPDERPRGAWTRAEIEREQAARRRRTADAAARGPSANLEQAAALNRFAKRFAEAFRRGPR